MKGTKIVSLVGSWCLSSLLCGGAKAVLLTPALPPPLAAAISASPVGGNDTFDQLIDHSDPSLGTFKQRYWWNTTYWAGPGSPVVLFTPGESDAEPYSGYITNRTMVGQYAQKIGGAMILLEHRYWGKSSPYTVLDTKNLTYLTLENAVADLALFTRTVKLPFDQSGATNSHSAPWVFVGGSYSGALAAWVHKLAPGTFWAYHASSGPVHAIYDYWSYFLPIYRGMPKNCSADLIGIANHIDRAMDRRNVTEIRRLKDMFGLSDVEHDDDFAAGVGSVVNMWQGIGPASNYSKFYKMCDSVEGVRPVEIWSANKTNSTGAPTSPFPYNNNTAPPSNVTVPPTGVGLAKALPNFASWFKNEYLPDSCSDYEYSDWNGTFNTACYDSYNTSSIMFTDTSLNNTVNRQWFWMLCNQPFAYWQVSSPKDQPSFIPRHVGPEYYQRQCELFFPAQGNATYGSANGKTTDMLNALTEGWDLANTTRLIWINGEFDPWRSASVSSEIRPGGPMQSTPRAPVYLLEGGVHCSDLTVRNGESNEGIKKAQASMVETVEKWVGEFYLGSGGNSSAKVTRAWVG